MSPARALPFAALLACAATAGPAAAKPFVVTTQGNSPSVAVDRGGVTHIAWDSTAADHSSITHYCRVPRNAGTCARGSERTFADFPADQDFGGPRVYLQGARDVLLVTARCCTEIDGNATRVYAYRSADGGATFGGATLIGTQTPDVAAAIGGAGFFSLGIADTGTALQALALDGFSATPNVITPDVAESGGVGPSPKGTLIAYATRQKRVYAGAVSGDPNTGPIAFKRFASGTDVVVASGPKGADLLYRSLGKKARYFSSRFANGRFGRPSAVSEPGFPIFGTSVQDSTGRVHVAWQGDRGLTYRRSAPSGRNFGAARSLSRKYDFYNLAIAANPKGKATVAYDSNEENGRVGGFTTG